MSEAVEKTHLLLNCCCFFLAPHDQKLKFVMLRGGCRSEETPCDGLTGSGDPVLRPAAENERVRKSQPSSSAQEAGTHPVVDFKTKQSREAARFPTNVFRLFLSGGISFGDVTIIIYVFICCFV